VRARLFACLLVMLATGCADRGARVVVFASASMATAFERIAAAFEQAHDGVDVVVHTGGTPLLVLQLREGAPADVFASADELQMRRVVDAGQVRGDAVAFAHNRLAIVARADVAPELHHLVDLTREGLAVALCGPEVPAGRYARQALAKAAVTLAPVSDEPSVSAVLSKVRLGQIDAGIVYTSDAARAPDLRIAPIEDRHNVHTSCWIAALDTGAPDADAAAFVAFVQSEQARAILRTAGFEAP